MSENTVADKIYRHAGNARVARWVPDEAKELLDVGCGAGDNARLLARPGRQIDGVTLSESEAELARQAMRTVLIHDLEKGLPQELAGPYEAVIASHVLEHICNPTPLLRDIHQRMTASGLLVVALPNLIYFRNRWKLLRGRIEYEGGGLMDNTHFRWYSFVTAQSLLREHGFEIRLAYANGNFPIPLVRRFLPAPLTRWIDAISCRFWPGLFGYEFIIVARKSS